MIMQCNRDTTRISAHSNTKTSGINSHENHKNKTKTNKKAMQKETNEEEAPRRDWLAPPRNNSRWSCKSMVGFIVNIQNVNV